MTNKIAYLSIIENEFDDQPIVDNEEDDRNSNDKTQLSRWAMLFSNVKNYWMIFNIIEILSSTYLTYFVGVLTTVENALNLTARRSELYSSLIAYVEYC
ncbi:hypothetical protein CEXT_342731 [Caerostris extrusa]|uniref:Uncharacterized protein n=1 Tax=Caerostris extrusa TaxID=172846 RepID=A0AAV4SHT1_CAEEX|nr:hypothetical protein CEXT_342731 [Caerostris extrusa]